MVTEAGGGSGDGDDEDDSSSRGLGTAESLKCECGGAAGAVEFGPTRRSDGVTVLICAKKCPCPSAGIRLNASGRSGVSAGLRQRLNQLGVRRLNNCTGAHALKLSPAHHNHTLADSTGGQPPPPPPPWTINPSSPKPRPSSSWTRRPSTAARPTPQTRPFPHCHCQTRPTAPPPTLQAHRPTPPQPQRPSV